MIDDQWKNYCLWALGIMLLLASFIFDRERLAQDALVLAEFSGMRKFKVAWYLDNFTLKSEQETLRTMINQLDFTLKEKTDAPATKQ